MVRPTAKPDERQHDERRPLVFLRVAALGVPVHVNTAVKTTHAKTIVVGEQHFEATRAERVAVG
jgi:hypothetical protein